jgi:hypothetical protein
MGEKQAKPYEVLVIGDSESNEDCLRGLIYSLLSQFADQTNKMLDIISREYEIDKEELSLTIKNNPEISRYLKPPVLKPMRTKSGRRIIIVQKPLN